MNEIVISITNKNILDYYSDGLILLEIHAQNKRNGWYEYSKEHVGSLMNFHNIYEVTGDLNIHCYTAC